MCPARCCGGSLGCIAPPPVPLRPVAGVWLPAPTFPPPWWSPAYPRGGLLGTRGSPAGAVCLLANMAVVSRALSPLRLGLVCPRRWLSLLLFLLGCCFPPWSGLFALGFGGLVVGPHWANCSLSRWGVAVEASWGWLVSVSPRPPVCVGRLRGLLLSRRSNLLYVVQGRLPLVLAAVAGRLFVGLLLLWPLFLLLPWLHLPLVAAGLPVVFAVAVVPAAAFLTFGLHPLLVGWSCLPPGGFLLVELLWLLLGWRSARRCFRLGCGLVVWLCGFCCRCWVLSGRLLCLLTPRVACCPGPWVERLFSVSFIHRDGEGCPPRLQASSQCCCSVSPRREGIFDGELCSSPQYVYGPCLHFV